MFFYLLRLFSTLFPLSAHRVVRTQCLDAAGWVCCLHSNHQEQRLICTVSEQGWGAVCAHVCAWDTAGSAGLWQEEAELVQAPNHSSAYFVWLRAHRCWSLGPTGASPSIGEREVLLGHAHPWHQEPTSWGQEVATCLFKVLEKLWHSLVLWYWCSFPKTRENPWL